MEETSSHSTYIRHAYHAGSWYSESQEILDRTLTDYLNAVALETTPPQQQQQQQEPPLRAILCPHAGYSYSGPTAAWSYYALRQELQHPQTPIRRIVLLHPSHHVYVPGCVISGASIIETPIGNLTVDSALREELIQSSNNNNNNNNNHQNSLSVTMMEQRVDEEEHSGEMQYPYIAKCFIDTNRQNQISILPIMCGNLSPQQERMYGQWLAPILAREDVICIISSDFCHWGSRFRYQPTPTTKQSPFMSTSSSTSLLSSSSSTTSTAKTTTTTTQEIYDYISELDHRGMSYIELQEPGAFATYLKQTQNTICGRHAIGVWLHAVHATKDDVPLDIRFVRYAQSSPARTMQDSSVSYASAVARRRKKK